MRILVFTTDMPPLAGFPTSGTALRTFGIAQGLREHGHEVIVSPPRDAVQGFQKSFENTDAYPKIKQQFESMKTLAFDSFNQSDLIRSLNPDVIFCGHWPALMLNTKPSQPVIVDLPGPYLLERFYQGDEDHQGATLAKLKVLSLADYYIVSGPSQRLYFLSYLMRAGIKNPETKIRTITMPLNPSLPEKGSRSKEYPHFMFGGVFLPWQNPSWGLTRVSDTIVARNKGRLTLIGGPHPNYPIDEGSYEKLFSSVCSNERVERKHMLPFDGFVNEMLGADVAIDLMQWNLERQLAVTIRTTTYLWAGLPVIYNDYADLGGLIKHYDAGWIIKPGNNDGLDTILNMIFDNPQEVAKKAINARKLAKMEFSWDKAVMPILDILTKPDVSSFRESDITIESKELADLMVTKSQPVEQYFACRVDGFSRLECNLATHNHRIQKPVTLRVFEVQTVAGSRARSLAVTGKKLVTEKTLAPEQLRNNEWLGVDFGPIPGSAGKVYSLQIASDEQDKNLALSPWTMKANPYPMLALAYGNEPIEQHCLSFRTIGSCVPNRN